MRTSSRQQTSGDSAGTRGASRNPRRDAVQRPKKEELEEEEEEEEEETKTATKGRRRSTSSRNSGGRGRKELDKEEEEEEEGEEEEKTPKEKGKTTAKKGKNASGSGGRKSSAKRSAKRRKVDDEEAGSDGDEDYKLEKEDEEEAEEGREEEEEEEEVDEEEEENLRRRRSEAGKRAAKKGRETRDARIISLHPELGEVWKGVDLDRMVKRLDTTKSTREAVVVEGVDQPPQLKLKLLPFQKEGVAWLKKQEHTIFHGGILADEMGMGKTIQTLSLILSDLPKKTTTLVICPTVAILQWQAEILNNTLPDTLTVLVYHGGNRPESIDVLKEHHVTITTYSVLESEFRRETKGYKRQGVTLYDKSLLHNIEWDRIILDEAHSIKDRSCSTARAAFQLQSKAKWSLSGTPLQNRVGELYSLIRFMRTYPYSYYFCAKCPCKSLSWKFSDYKHCDECGHKPMSHFCWWNKEILKPIQKFGSQGEGRVAFVKLGHLLNKIMLRRTKLERSEDLGLPPRVVTQRGCLFNDEEMDFYEALFSESKTKFLAYVNQGTVLNHYAHIFDLLMKMRQAANHPYMVVYGRHQTDEHTDICGVCQEEAEDPIIAKCHHVFCREDIRLYISSALDGSEHPQCPVCFVPLTIDLNQPTLVRSKKQQEARQRSHQSILNRMDIGGWKSSTKIEALLEELTKLRERDCTIKSIVFSQFVSFLDIIEWRLLRCGFRCVKLDGRMLPAQRDAVINAFMTNPAITVFLVSLKAGGVALNLTEASRVFLMDPWWNPAVEDQAMDRIHRLGQYRPIEVIRIIVDNSIESRIVELQRKKHLLFQSTVGMDIDALNRLTEEDLQFLFTL
eukprot:comp23393_c0_seq1/m.38771 comp23393_c0_seq1/g.38771  ORF comp23393_c0_seq1/g.38771 comp23393_c0_seq1/m.38771 type:complete len:846 (-) comp23393_c0_seq1:948-3485(-)